MKKRLLSSLLSLCMLLSLLPASALAVEEKPEQEVLVELEPIEFITAFPRDFVTFAAVGPDKNDYPADKNYFGSQLTTNAEKAIYSELCSKIATTTNAITINMTSYGLSETDFNSAVRNAVAAFDRDHSDIFWTSGSQSSYYMNSAGNVTTATITLPIAASWDSGGRNITTDNATVATKVSYLKGEAEKASDRYTQLKTVHDWLVNNNTYNSAQMNDKTISYKQEAVSAFDDKLSPVCEGYSRAFKLVCDALNIPCVLVSGTARGAHMWNYVQMDDNKWYAVDVTWDDPVSDMPVLRQDYFLVGKDKMDSDHTNTSDDFLTNGNMAFSYPTLNPTKYTPPKDVKNLAVSAPTSVSVPTVDDNYKTEFSLTATADYDDGTSGTVSAAWSISTAAGVTIDQTTGKLTITSDAAAGTVTVTANYGGKTAKQDITLTKADPFAAKIELAADSATSIIIPETVATTETYRATVYDQYGAEFITDNVSWTLTPSGAAGVSRSPETGASTTVSVESGATEGTYKLTASYGSVSADIDIVVSKLPAHTLTFTGPSSLSISILDTNVGAAAAHGPNCPCKLTQAITYSSSDPSVVAVNPTTGKLTPVKVSTAPVTITATIQGDSNYATTTATYTVTVTPADLSAAAVTLSPSGATYTGSAIEPVPTVTLGGKRLVKDADYTVAYADNENAGTAKVTITGKGNYSGTKEVTFTISKATPQVTGVAVDGTVYTVTAPNAVKLTGTAKNGEATVAGTLALTPGQTLTEGKKNYNWTFTPDDTANYNTQTGTIAIEVKAREVKELKVDGELTTKTYQYDDTFDPAGVTVNAYYADAPDKAEDVTDQATFNVDKLLTVGEIPVKVTFGGKTVDVDTITVNKRVISFTPAWTANEFIFDGTEKVVTVSNVPTGVVAAYTNNKGTDAGAYDATATFTLATGYSSDNYDLQTPSASTPLTIAKANTRNYATKVSVKVNDASAQTVDLSKYIPSNSKPETPTVAFSGAAIAATPTATVQTLTFKIAGSAIDGAAGTITITVASQNYKDITIEVSVGVTSKEIPVLSANDYTRVYNGKAVTVGELTKSATVKGEAAAGDWAFVGPPPTNVAESGTHVLRFAPSDNAYCVDADTAVVIIITKATPTGAPGYTAVTTSGKTLANVPLTIGTLSPAGTVAWVLPDSTAVQANTAYTWKFIPNDTANYNELTGQIIPYYIQSGSSGGSGGGGSSKPATTPSSPVTTGTGSQNGNRVTQTTAKPTATVSGGTATATVTSDIGKEIVEQAVKNDSDTVVIAPDIRNGISSTQVIIPSSTVSDLGRRTNADVVVDTPVAQVTIPNGALSGLSRGDLTVSAQRQGSTLTVTVQSGSQTISSVSGGLSVTAPASQAASGTVAILVNSDGSREVIRKSVVVGSKINIPLNGTARVEIVDNSKRFVDVSSSNWAYNAVSFASGHELFNGTSEGVFSPNASMTRGMLAVVLHNLENNPSGNRGGSFTDVTSGAWYDKAVSWAAGQGIVSGYPDGSFGANDSVTREQLAVILYRYAGSPRAGSTPTNRFGDAASISAYAQSAMNWAVANGIINGVGNSTLDPQGLATRAQVAQMLKNFVEAQF